MSRSNNNAIENPSKKFFQWSGSEGKLHYYDKEQGANINVPLPFTFMVLDELSTIKGFSESSGSGIWSNEIRDFSTDIIVAKDKNGEIAKGIYKEIKDKVSSYGGKYAKSVYIAYKEKDGELTIGNISFMGSSFGGGVHKKKVDGVAKPIDIEVPAWLEFSKKFRSDILKKAITINKNEMICTNGSTQFYCPKFKLTEITPETDAACIALDKTLQAYLTEYFKLFPKVEKAQTVSPVISSEAKPFEEAPKQVNEDLEKAAEFAENYNEPEKHPEMDFGTNDSNELPF